MPPKQAAARALTPRVTFAQRADRVRALSRRITNPPPPTQPEVFDRGTAEDVLEASHWDVDLAEARWRNARARVRLQAAADAQQQVAVTAAPVQATQQPVQEGPGAGIATNGTSSRDTSSSSSDGESSSLSDVNSPTSSTSPKDAGDTTTARLMTRTNHPEILQLMRNSRLPTSEGEQERRDAAIAFRMAIKDQHKVDLSISEAILLLLMAGWDIGVALASFGSHVDARRRLRTEFDGLRNLPQVPVNDSVQESKCLQVLTEITARSDWLSLKLALQKFNWNLVKTVVHWYKKGISVFRKDDIPKGKRRNRGWGQRVDRWGRKLDLPTKESTKPAAGSDHSGWAVEGADFSNPGDQHPVTPRVHGQKWRDFMTARAADPKTRSKKIRDNRGREQGFVINGDRATRKPGLVFESDFLLEWYHRGTYWFKIFTKDGYTFEQDVSDEGKSEESSDSDSDDTPSPPPAPRKGPPPVPFDSTKQSHVDHLNGWRRNTHWLVEQENIREPTQVWTQEELDFLYQLMANLLAAYKRQYPRSTRFELVQVLTIDAALKKKWETDFNNRFSGTIAPGQQYPRHDRTAGAIIQQRTRFPKLATHFRIQLNETWEKSLSEADKAATKQFEKERDEMEDTDAALVAALNRANPPATDNPGEGRLLRKPRAKKRKRSTRSASAEDNAGQGDGDAGGDGGDGGSGGPAAGGSGSAPGGSGAGGSGAGGSGAGGFGAGAGTGTDDSSTLQRSTRRRQS